MNVNAAAESLHHTRTADWKGSPQIGAIEKAYCIGYKGRGTFIWAACVECGKERWVPTKFGNPKRTRCLSCSHRISTLKFVKRGEHNHGWKGGRWIDRHGYVTVRIPVTHPFFAMASNRHSSGVIKEHRLVMAQYVGRCLTSKEVVHHFNGVRDDNRIENLCCLSPNKHNHIAHSYTKALQARIRELEEKI